MEIRSLKEEVHKTGSHAKEAEEEVERLKNSLSAAQRAHLLTQKELLTTRTSLGTSQQLAQRLQQDCDTLANQMSSWAQDHRWASHRSWWIAFWLFECPFDAPSMCVWLVDTHFTAVQLVTVCAVPLYRVSQETLSERIRALQKDVATLQADKE